MDKATFVQALTEARAQWDALLAEVGQERMLDPGAAGKWSVKDIIAHILWSEREMAPIIQTHILDGSELWNLPQDDRNEVVYQQNRDRPIEEILAEAQQVYAQLFEAVQTLSDEDLNDPYRFKNMPEDWVPWRIIAGCSFDHYRDHSRSIREWLATTKA